MNAFTTTRRRLLAGLAAAAATAAATPRAVASQSYAEELPELFALGEQLPAVRDEYLAARAEYSDCLAQARSSWPEAPAVLCTPRPEYSWGGNLERDIKGAAITRSGQEGPFIVTTAEDIQRDITELERSIRRKRKNPVFGAHTHLVGWKTMHVDDWRVEHQRLSAVLAEAQAYEGEMQRIRKVLRFEEIDTRHTAAREGLQELVGRIMVLRPETIDGVLIQAEALDAWGQIDDFWRMTHLPATEDNWVATFAASIIRVAGSSV